MAYDICQTCTLRGTCKVDTEEDEHTTINNGVVVGCAYYMYDYDG